MAAHGLKTGPGASGQHGSGGPGVTSENHQVPSALVLEEGAEPGRQGGDEFRRQGLTDPAPETGDAHHEFLEERRWA